MSRIDSSVKIARQEVGVSTHVPITHFNSPTILESTSGALFSVIKVAGVPFETEKTDTVNGHQQAWHRALTALDERFSVVGTVHRRKENCDLGGYFSTAFATSVDDAYHAQFKGSSMYVNELYLAIVYKGITTGHTGKVTRLLQKVSGRYVKQAREARREHDIKQLTQAVFQLTTSLSAFRPHVMGEEDEALGYSELLSYVSLLVNGGEPLKFKYPTHCPPVATTFDNALAAQQRYPLGNVAQYVTAKRLFFGDCIQFQGALPSDARFGAMVSVKRYGADTASVMLDPLLRLDCEFISTHSFTIESKAQADKRISRQTNKLLNAEDAAVSQLEGLLAARDMLASDRMAMGYHHNSVLLLSDSKEALEGHVANTITCYMNAGMVAVRETLGQEAAFWAQLPTNARYRARASLMTSENFVDFFPLHNYRTGFRDGNHLGAALTLVQTPSKTPLFLNLHARGPLDNPAPGHTTLIGGNGSGKTVAMCFLDAQLNRYGGSSFFFDRNRGAEIYIRASGGYYAVLSPDHAQDIQFNPLQLEDTPTNRKFCKDWLVQLVRREDEVAVDEAVVEQLEHCVAYAFEQLAAEHRTLSNATKVLPVNFERWILLKRWLKGDLKQTDGEYAYLFDHAVDALSMRKKMGFDMTHFLDNEPPSVLAAVTMYLFHRLDISLNEGGPLVSVFLDEAWQYLDNPYWQSKLKKWLPTLRKLNCHLVFATQSPKSVAFSAISHTILDNCATNLYFANPQAKPEHYIDGFNLTQTEFACIRDNEPQSRLFLYKQGHTSSLGKLNLSHLKELLSIMSGTQATVNLLTRLREEVGDDPAAWIPLFLKRRQVL